jgi:hypothetical protein
MSEIPEIVSVGKKQGKVMETETETETHVYIITFNATTEKE